MVSANTTRLNNAGCSSSLFSLFMLIVVSKDPWSWSCRGHAMITPNGCENHFKSVPCEALGGIEESPS